MATGKVIAAVVVSVDGFVAGADDGPQQPVRQALAAASGRDVRLVGASIVQQCLRAALLDELTIELVPVILGRGTRLLDNPDPDAVNLDLVRVIDAPGVVHLTYRAIR